MRLAQTSRIATLGLLIVSRLSFAQAPPPASPAPPNAAQQPNGVEVLARGPIHEAFATPHQDAKPNYAVPKKPPVPIEEMPPEERPEGDVIWIGGYWAWDDDRQDFLWVSGCWRNKPQGKEWVPGYWRDVSNQWQWVSGFWTQSQEGQQSADVTYLPEPPAPPQVAPAGEAPGADMFYVPGYWMYTSERYVWRVGYWTRSRPGYVYVSSHYRWTPHGHVFIAGYWDYAVPRRGVLYAPVVVNPVVVGPRFVYTPYYAVSDTVVVDFLFVRPGFCHYYFGDYYGPRYATLGFECGYVYGRRHYDPIVAYRRWEYRDQPRWLDVRIGITIDRGAGRAYVPPRTLVQQNTIVQNNVNVTNVTNVTNVKNVTINNTNNTQVLAPTKTIVANQGAKTVAVDPAARTQAANTAQAVQKTASMRQTSEGGPRTTTGPTARPATKSFNLPTAAVGNPATGNSNPGGTSNPGGQGTRPNPTNPFTKSPGNTTPPNTGVNPLTQTPPKTSNPGTNPMTQPPPKTSNPGTNPMTQPPPKTSNPGTNPLTQNPTLKGPTNTPPQGNNPPQGGTIPPNGKPGPTPPMGNRPPMTNPKKGNPPPRPTPRPEEKKSAK